MPFQPSGSSVDNFSPMMIPIDPMMASPELSYHMMGYHGMPPGYPQRSPSFQLPMDYAAPGYNSYVGMALEEQHRMAGLGAAPFPGNPLMYLSGTYPQMASQQYSMYSGRPQHNKPAPPPPPSSHILGRQPQNKVEPPREKPSHYDHSPQQRDRSHPDSYLDRRIDVPDRTKLRPDERSRDQEPSEFRYHSHESVRPSDHYRERESFDRYHVNDYQSREPQAPRYLHDDRKDPQAEATKVRPRPVEDIYRDPIRSDYDRHGNRRDPRQPSISPAARNPRFGQRSISPSARNPRFDQRPYEPPRRAEEPPRRPDDHRNDPRFDRRSTDKSKDLYQSRDRSTDAYQSRYDYGRHNERHDQDLRSETADERQYRDHRIETGNGRNYRDHRTERSSTELHDRDLRDERTALTGRASSREPAVTSMNDVNASSTDKAGIYHSIHSRGLDWALPERAAQNELVPIPNKPLVTLIASHPAHDGVKISSPEEGEISLKAQLAQRKASELAKPIDPRRPSVEKLSGIESKTQSKDSVSSKTESEPTRMLFCRNIPKSWTEPKLREIYGGFGEIIEMNLTHLQSRGIGFIRFYDIRSAITAKDRLDGKSLQEYGSDASLSVHFSKSEEEKSPNIDCTLEHYQVICLPLFPLILTLHQGTLLVRLTKKEHTHSMVRKLVTILSNYGAIKAKHDASIINKQGLLVEFYDARHCAAAFYGLNRTKLGSLVLRLSLEWDIPDPEPAAAEEAPKAPNVPPSAFFIDVHGDERKRRISSSPVDLAEIIRKDIVKPDNDAVLMERLEFFPPNRLSDDGQEGSHANAETSTPILLQQMSSLLSSLQKNQTEPLPKKATIAELPQRSKPPQKSSLNEPDVFKSLKPDQPVSVKPFEVPVKIGESAVVSSGGVVSANRMKKAPTLESVQQLAKLLLQQTRDT